MYCLDYTKEWDIGRTINCICCRKFETVKNQTKAYENGKLTLVGFIHGHYSAPFWEFNQKLEGEPVGFEGYSKLHATLLTLTKDKIINSGQVDSLSSSVENFINSNKILLLELPLK